MSTHRTGTLAAALALTAATTVAVAPAASAAPTDPTAGPTTVQYVAQGTGTGSTSGSMDNELVQVGLVLIAGIGVSALLAIGAGVAGGGIEVPEIPGLPF